MAKIFLSSTYEDLKEFRETVNLSLEKMKHEVIAMEKYVATDQRPLEKVLQDVRSCNLYIGIFAWRYGYIPKRNNPQEKSITELEFRQAIASGIDCLCFVLDQKANWSPLYMDQGPESSKINELRTEILSNYLAGIFDNNPDNLANAVSSSVNNWQNRSSLSRKLSDRYAPNTDFYIVEDTGNPSLNVSRQTSYCLVNELKIFLDKDASEIRIGVVGGKTVRDMLIFLPDILKNDNYYKTWDRLTFVSMNMAGHTASFDLCANYIATMFAYAFCNARHLAALPNASKLELDVYNYAHKNLDMLICSAGARDGFINDYLSHKSCKLPQTAVGDFCLWPISEEMHNIALDNKRILSILNELQPKPIFKSLPDISKKKISIILPIASQKRKSLLQNRHLNDNTNKESITKIILSSGIITSCILNESLSESLLQ